MVRQLLLALSATLLLATSCSVQAARPHPDCTNTFTSKGVSLSSIETLCSQVSDEKMFQNALMLDEFKKIEVVESCACALVNHELAWASLMTLEGEVLFQAVKMFVDKRSEKNDAIENLRKSPSQVLFRGEDGERRWYWNSLDYILKQATGENDDEEISFELRENFANLYYDPNTYKLKWKDLVQSQKLRAVISGICSGIIRKFAAPFLQMFDRLSKLADNSYLFFILTAYNDDLYKLRMNTRACLYLRETGQLHDNV